MGTQILHEKLSRPVLAAMLLLAVAGTGTTLYLLGGKPTPPAALQREIASPDGQLTTLVYDARRNILAAGSASGKVLVWKTESRSLRPLQQLTKRPITALAFSSDGFLLAGCLENRLLGWQAAAGDADRLNRTLPDLPAAVTALAVHPQRFEAVLGFSNGQLAVIGGENPRTFSTEHSRGVKALTYSPNGEFLVSGGAEGRLSWWNAETFQAEATRQAHSGELSDAAFSADGTQLATGDWDGEIALWSAASRTEQQRFRQKAAVADLAWQNGNLVTASWDGRLRFFSPREAQRVRQIDTGQPLYALAVPPDRQWVATVANGSTIRLWQTRR